MNAIIEAIIALVPVQVRDGGADRGRDSRCIGPLALDAEP